MESFIIINTNTMILKCGEINCEKTNQFEHKTNDWELLSTDIKMYQWRKYNIQKYSIVKYENGIYDKIVTLNG